MSDLILSRSLKVRPLSLRELRYGASITGDSRTFWDVSKF
jgi:hypothetical protein